MLTFSNNEQWVRVKETMRRWDRTLERRKGSRGRGMVGKSRYRETGTVTDEK